MTICASRCVGVCVRGGVATGKTFDAGGGVDTTAGIPDSGAQNAAAGCATGKPDPSSCEAVRSG